MLLGVCGGIAEFIDWPKQTVRILWLTLTIFGGLGIFAYLILGFLMPPPSSDKGNFDIDDYRVE